MGKAIRFANSKDFQEMKEDTLHLLKNIEHMDISEIVDSIRIFSQKKGMIDDYLDLMLLWYRDVLMFKVTKDANLCCTATGSTISPIRPAYTPTRASRTFSRQSTRQRYVSVPM